MKGFGQSVFMKMKLMSSMRNKDLGHVATHKQCIDRKDFLVHCQKDDHYATKIMSTHVLLMQKNHTTYGFIDEEWKSFKYVKSLSQRNKCQHWVHDVNKISDMIRLD